MSDFKGVRFKPKQVIPPGVYDATLSGFSDVQRGQAGEYVFWRFKPDAYPDVEVDIITSCGEEAGPKSKGGEFARRITGKSDATDEKWGRDIKDRRPWVDWGPGTDVDVGARATIVVFTHYDEQADVEVSRVRNVVTLGALPADNGGGDAGDLPEADDIPF